MEKKDRKAERSARKGARKIKRLGKKITRQQIRADKKSEASAKIVEKRNASQKKIRGLMDNQPPNTTLKEKHNNFTTRGLGKGKMIQGGGPPMAPSNKGDYEMRTPKGKIPQGGESNKQERKNLIKDNPVAKKASGKY